jgi:predicted peroxiredoxin
MSNYLLIESRDPFGSNAVEQHVALAASLKRAGHEVALYLVQEGVLPCRAGADGEMLHEAIAAGIEVLADDFSLRERGIGADDIARGVKSAAIDTVVGRLAASWKAIFF